MLEYLLRVQYNDSNDPVSETNEDNLKFLIEGSEFNHDERAFAILKVSSHRVKHRCIRNGEEIAFENVTQINDIIMNKLIN